MIKRIAWNTFKNTGDVNTFLELKQIQNLEQQLEINNKEHIIEQKIGVQEEQNGNSKNEWNNNL